MTALLTDNLPLLAGAPNGIQKLRELILELAVRGKLVPQDPSDEPASELLNRIAEEKARLVAEGKIRKQKPLAEIGEEEKPFELPAGWEWVRLGDLCLTQTGTTPSKNQTEFFGSDFPFIKPGDIYLDQVDYSGEGLSYLGVSQGGRIARSGSLLMVCIGTIGKCNVIDRDCSFNQQINSATIYEGHPHYLRIAARSPYFQEKAWGESSSTTIAILNKGKWEAIPIPLPSIAEQHRIVVKVDELMALCDRLEARQSDAASAHARLVQALLDSLTQASDADDFAASWQRLAEHFHSLFTSESSIDALKQTLLQLAVMGKLVPQDPSDEPASELLKRIAEEKARLVVEGKIKKQKPLAEIGEDEKPFELPVGWEWVRLGQVSEASTGHAFKSSEYKQSGTFVLRVTNINPDGTIDLSEAKYIDPFEAVSTYKDVILEGGDILLVMVGGSLGKIGIVDEGSLPAVLNQNMWKIFRPDRVARDYLVYGLRFINSTQIKVTSSTHGHLAQGEYLSKLFPLAPEAEQHRIVAKVEQLMSICDQLKARLTATRQLHERLAGVLVEQAVA